MTKRYYICDIIGDGTDGPKTPTTGPFRPTIADLGVAWVGQIPTGEDGRPLKTWALVLVNTDNHARVIASRGVDALPDFPLDGKINAINNVTRNAMIGRLGARGMDTSFIGNADGYREVIRGIGRQVDQTFDENNFDVV